MDDWLAEVYPILLNAMEIHCRGNYHRAQDATQEAVCRAREQEEGFFESAEDLLRWLRTTAAHFATDEFRHHRRWNSPESIDLDEVVRPVDLRRPDGAPRFNRLAPNDPDPPPPSLPPCVQRRFKQLSAERQRILNLRSHGLTFEEIGARVYPADGRTASARGQVARREWFRAIQQLRTWLMQDGVDPDEW